MSVYKMAGSMFFATPSKGNPPRTLTLTALPMVLDTALGTIEEVQITQIVAYISENFFYTHAATSAIGTTNLASTALRALYPKGLYQFDVSAMTDEKIYIKSADGADHASAVSLSFFERD